jgi:hypothetical protein
MGCNVRDWSLLLHVPDCAMGLVEEREGRPQISGRVLRRVLQLSALAAACAWGAPTHAQELRSLGVGGFVGFSFGRKASVEWGFEAFSAFSTTRDDLCSPRSATVVGPLVQFAMLGRGEPRLTFAAHGGYEPDEGTGIIGEAGLTLRFLEQIRYGLHTGIVFERSILNVYARQEWLITDLSVGVGGRVLPTFNNLAFCVEGRPLRTAESARMKQDAPRAELTNPMLAACEVGREWADSMQHEHDSVFAFLQLAAELDAAHAPRTLVDRALAAAQDEIVHASLCAQLARRFMARAGADPLTIRPRTPAGWARPCLPSRFALQRLATESVLDGSLNEGIAAAEAFAASSSATDPQSQLTLRRIAREERQHEALAWDVLSWSYRRGGVEVRSALRELRPSLNEASLASASEPPSARGGLSSDARCRIRRSKHAEVLQRLDHLLAS